ncbi:MAG: hypothetical protein EHM14_10290 [Methanothrix sp.]|nr:MAG: hypothetical protein EHM14_10290 [Methanothrix sp.]
MRRSLGQADTILEDPIIVSLPFDQLQNAKSCKDSNSNSKSNSKSNSNSNSNSMMRAAFYGSRFPFFTSSV